MTEPGFSRRSFLKGASIAAAIPQVSAAETAPPPNPDLRVVGTEPAELKLTINGVERRFEVEPRTTLLDLLRDHADLTGTKKVCDRGACGGCTVLLDGEPINSCLTLAFDAEGRALRTIEGLADGDRLHPVQAAFVRCDALQCGFCTPGFVMSSVACLEHHETLDRATLERELSGNLCRCGTYGRIVEAVESTRASKPAKGGAK
jgi:xanthine dehydrogenase YagT iron-sulfur-binding subunit